MSGEFNDGEIPFADRPFDVVETDADRRLLSVSHVADDHRKWKIRRVGKFIWKNAIFFLKREFSFWRFSIFTETRSAGTWADNAARFRRDTASQYTMVLGHSRTRPPPPADTHGPLGCRLLNLRSADDANAERGRRSRRAAVAAQGRSS
ncbi:Hypothetical protein NTJ_06753 [Nesidiocoris tenuis]|uniref:Uncharacterized protein n=1 Tax=Nesidiocoris tenuis TaxID=355587 RepID=A0ABN7ARM3_9HEMI|nr:Hypothetical protein NTJ_06753 [Nesidiocoris tenuis]